MRNWLIVVALFLVGCEETIKLDLHQAEPNVVIEGMVTNRRGHQYVKVSRTGDFYLDGLTPPVTDASVQVTDDQGGVYAFTHNPENHDYEKGYYYPTSIFTGKIGRTYTLEVSLEGTTYTATSTLLPVMPIDSLGVRINQDEKKDPVKPGRFYEILLYAHEPQSTRDYYLFKFYRNDSIVHDPPNEIYFTDDRALGERINGVPSPVYYKAGDMARLEIYSLTREGYLFYNDLYSLLNNDGGMFSPPPVNCRTNLSNNALGFFQTSALASSQIDVK